MSRTDLRSASTTGISGSNFLISSSRSVVMRQVRKPQRAILMTSRVWIVFVLMRTRHEMIRQLRPHTPAAKSRRPVRKRVVCRNTLRPSNPGSHQHTTRNHQLKIIQPPQNCVISS